MVSGWVPALTVATLLAGPWVNGARAGTCTLPAWGVGSSLPAAVFGHAVTSAGGLVYVAAGFDSSVGTVVNQFASYNPATNSWTSLAAVPTPVMKATLAHDAAGGRLFLFGGANAALNTVLNIVQVYTISTNTWSSGPVLPAVRMFMGGGTLGGMIYLVGGYNAVTISPPTVQNQNWQFNPATGIYTTMAPLPAGLGGAGSGVSGGRLYIMGGRDGVTSNLGTNYEYTPATNSWATRAPLLTPVNLPGATELSGDVSCNGDIIVVGGGDPFLSGEAFSRDLSRVGDTTGVSQLYNVATNSWSAGPTLPTARAYIGAAQAGNTLIAVGGNDGVGPSSVATVDRIQGPPLPVDLGGVRIE